MIHSQTQILLKTNVFSNLGQSKKFVYFRFLKTFSSSRDRSPKMESQKANSDKNIRPSISIPSEEEMVFFVLSNKKIIKKIN